jgi:asparagine synthase (glutamine-hydrolysing)
LYRYIAFRITPTSDATRSQIIELMDSIEPDHKRIWQKIHDTHDLLIWHCGAEHTTGSPLVLDDGTVLLGKTFSRATGFPEWRNDPPLTSAVGGAVRDRVGWLFRNIWGDYVGFHASHGYEDLHVFRDPCGGLPCFHLHWRGVDIFASNAEIFTRLPGQRFTIDYSAIVGAAVLPNVSKLGTGLREVDTVLPGELSTFAGERKREYLWDPVSLADNPLTLPLDEIAALLRTTLDDVTKALTRRHTKILHNLGGLDSSIVLASLAETRVSGSFACVTHYSDSFRGDERHYTRAMAQHVGADLIETRLDPSRVDLEVLERQELGPSPSSVFDCLQMAGDLYGLAREHGIDAFTYGFGGDSVLYHMPGILSALDHVSLRQPLAQLPRVVLDAAQYGGLSMARTAGSAVLERFRPLDCSSYVLGLIPPQPRTQFLNQDLVDVGSLKAGLHPVLHAPKNFPKGKYLQLVTSAFLNIDYHLSQPGYPEVDRIYPILAQPVLELCLRLPTWQQVCGGIDRYVARIAFKDRLPAAIVGRVSKSTPEEIYDQVFQKECPRLQQTLLDGILVREGILSRPLIEKALAGQEQELPASKAALMQFYDWEVWARRWQSAGQSC